MMSYCQILTFNTKFTRVKKMPIRDSVTDNGNSNESGEWEPSLVLVFVAVLPPNANFILKSSITLKFRILFVALLINLKY